MIGDGVGDMKRKDLRKAAAFVMGFAVVVIGVAVGVENWVVGLAGGWILVVGIWGLIELIRKNWMVRWLKFGLSSVLILNTILAIWSISLFIHEANNQIECEKDRDDSCYLDSIFQVIFQACYVSSSITLLYFNGYLLVTFYENWKNLLKALIGRQ